MRGTLPAGADVVVIGAGVVGAACAFYAARAGLAVLVVDSGPVAGGTTGAGEGNILVSDKEPGPELELALASRRLWEEDLADLADAGEFETKGGLVVTGSAGGVAALRDLTARQRAAGVVVEDLPADRLADHEPHLATDLAGGALYPQDAQVQPMLAAAAMLRAVRSLGGTVAPHHRVTDIVVRDGMVVGVRTDRGQVTTPAVVNAAGTWGGAVADLAGIRLPVLPRRGMVLVTEPLPLTVHHKVYGADYVANVASGSADLATSPVVEGTRSGTVLIGSSRERVGFDRSPSLPILRRLAADAVRLFPILDTVRVMRSYTGFRPYCPDHLPVIGADPRVPGMWHACGHEGAGVGLAPATGRAIAAGLTGQDPGIDLTPLRPDRFETDEVTR